MTDSNSIADLSSGAGRGVPPAKSRANAVRWRPVAKPKLEEEDKKKFLDRVETTEEPKTLALPEVSRLELFNRMEDEVMSAGDEDEDEEGPDSEVKESEIKNIVKTPDRHDIWDEKMDYDNRSMRMHRDVAIAHSGKKYPCGCSGEYAHRCDRYGNSCTMMARPLDSPVPDEDDEEDYQPTLPVGGRTSPDYTPENEEYDDDPAPVNPTQGIL